MASETATRPAQRYRTAARFLFRSLTLRGASFLLALMAVTTGATLTAAMLNLEADLGAKMSHELRRYGPNLLVTPATGAADGAAAATLDEVAVRRALAAVAPGVAVAPVSISAFLITSGWVRAMSASTARAGVGGPPLEPHGGGLERENARSTAATRTPEAAAGEAAPNSDASGPGLVSQAAEPGPFNATTARAEFAATIVGADFAALRQMSPAWRIEGAWPSSGGRACLVGASLARRVGLLPGTLIVVGVSPAHPIDATDPLKESPTELPPPDTAAGSPKAQPSALPRAEVSTLEIAGILSTGESEDEQVIVPLALLQSVTGLPGRISLAALAIDGGSARVEGIARALEPALPGATAHVLRQVAAAQGVILGKLGRMMLLLTLVVLTLSGLCFTTTLMAIVIEREGEIGLMRSIGAGDGEILAMFLGEAGLLGLMGGLLGFALGALSARLIGTRLFDAAIEPRAAVFGQVVLGAVLLCLLSVLLPLRRALRIQPAAALRGD